MIKYNKLLRGIFRYSLSPILMMGNELPGVAASLPIFNDVKEIWEPMSELDFPGFADLIEEKKNCALNGKDWEEIGGILYRLLQNKSVTHTARLTLLINFAYANHFAGRRNWTEGVLLQAEKFIRENDVDDLTLVRKVGFAKKLLL